MKLFLDDLRACPDGYTLCRTAEEAIALLKTGDVTEISFDHDLGTDPVDGETVAKFIEEAVYFQKIPMPEWTIHSANPVGRQEISLAMTSAERYA
jgi:hypothetical protein